MPAHAEALTWPAHSKVSVSNTCVHTSIHMHACVCMRACRRGGAGRLLFFNAAFGWVQCQSVRALRVGMTAACLEVPVPEKPRGSWCCAQQGWPRGAPPAQGDTMHAHAPPPAHTRAHARARARTHLHQQQERGQGGVVRCGHDELRGVRVAGQRRDCRRHAVAHAAKGQLVGGHAVAPDLAQRHHLGH